LRGRAHSLVIVASTLLPSFCVAGMPIISGQTLATSGNIGVLSDGMSLSAQLPPLSCSKLESVVAAPAPSNIVKRPLSYVESAIAPTPREPISYELWTVTGCARSAEFVVEIWLDESGTQRVRFYPVRPAQDGS